MPRKAGRTAYLIEKNMPQDKLADILEKAKTAREAGEQINVVIMKKNKKFQKEQLAAEGYENIIEFFNREEQ